MSWFRATPARWLVRVRRATLLLAFLAGLYVYLRIELMTLPAAGCSPLYGVDPGDRMVLDRRPGQIGPGDAILFEGPDGRLHLARVVDAPTPAGAPGPGDGAASPPADLEPGALWAVVERADCPGLDSTQLGPIARAQVRAEVLLFLSGDGPMGGGR